MLNNFLEHVVTLVFSQDLYAFDLKVSVVIIFAGCPCSYFHETLTFVDFYMVMHSYQIKLQEAVSVL